MSIIVHGYVVLIECPPSSSMQNARSIGRIISSGGSERISLFPGWNQGKRGRGVEDIAEEIYVNDPSRRQIWTYPFGLVPRPEDL